MAESVESILLRLGFDASSVTAGTEKMMSVQRTAARDYVSVWETALAKKDATEKVQLDASWARYQANLEKKAAADKLFFEQQAARYAEKDEISAIGRGSIPANMQSAGGRNSIGSSGMGGMAGAQIAGDIASGADAETIGRGAGSLGIIAVGMALGHRMERTITHMARLVMRSVIGRALAVVAAGVGGWKLGTMINDKFINAPLDASFKSLEGTTEFQQHSLAKFIGDLEKSGILNREQAAQMIAQSGGSATGMKTVQSQLRRIVPEGMTAESARLFGEAHVKEESNRRAGLTSLQRLDEDTIKQAEISSKMLSLKRNTAEYAEAERHQAEIVADILKDRKDVERDILEKKKMEAEIAGKKKDEAEHTKKEGEAEAKIGRLTPTLEDLAGRNYTKRLNAAYGEGGQFDLGAGNGPFAQAARDAELADKQQLWDLIHGNVADAEFDRVQGMAARNKLKGTNLETPDMVIKDLRDNLQAYLNKTNDDIAAIRVMGETKGFKFADD